MADLLRAPTGGNEIHPFNRVLWTRLLPIQTGGEQIFQVAIQKFDSGEVNTYQVNAAQLSVVQNNLRAQREGSIAASVPGPPGGLSNAAAWGSILLVGVGVWAFLRGKKR